jgi:glycosyltransferase involved in cell wall biosynthesis
MNEIQYNLVLQDRNWVMENLANHFHKYIPSSKISDEADPNSDINFYFNWHGMRSKTNFDVCYFTHIENRAWWDLIADSCDVALLMGEKYDGTVPENKKIFFYPPPFESFLPQKKPKILIVGRSYSSGRKNFGSISDVLKGFDIEITFTEGKLSQKELIDAYANTDYVLVTSKIEAGPMCVVEAIAMNKPVIAPDVGFCWNYPVIKYNTEEELHDIFRKLVLKKNAWEDSVDSCIKSIEKIYEKTKK